MERKLNNFYLHAISFDFNELNKEDLILLNDILKSGYLYSREKLNIESEFVGFNGLKYISLCDYSKRKEKALHDSPIFKDYNSYNACIRDSLSLILKKGNYKIIKPELTYPHVFSAQDAYEVNYLGRLEDERYTDMPDEVQVKDQLSLENLVGISLPISYNLTNGLNIRELRKYLCLLREVLKENNREGLPVYDLDTGIKIPIKCFRKVYTK